MLPSWSSLRTRYSPATRRTSSRCSGSGGARQWSFACSRGAGRSSDPLDAHRIGVGRQCSEVLEVGAEHDTARFGTGYDEGVHGRPAPGPVTELSRPAGERGRYILAHIAGLEQPVHGRVIALTSRGRFGEDDGRNQRWPLSVPDERTDGSEYFLVPLSQDAHSSGVQDEHLQPARDAPAFVPRTRWARRSALAADAGEGSPTSPTSSAR